MQKTFYTVWRKHGGPPTKAHETLELARAEAERLAREKGGDFFVMKAIGLVVREEQPVRFDILEDQ